MAEAGYPMPCGYCCDADYEGPFAPIHPECDQMVADYIESQEAEWRWRDGKPCRCGHDGSEHDHDEVGECGRCGCVAWRPASKASAGGGVA